MTPPITRRKAAVIPADKGRKARLDIYAFIRGYKKLNGGKSPTIREIQAACNISTTSLITHHLAKLAAQGAIQFTGSAHANTRRISLPGESYILPEAVEIK